MQHALEKIETNIPIKITFLLVKVWPKISLLATLFLIRPSIFAVDFGTHNPKMWECHFQGKSADSVAGVSYGSEYTVNAFGVGYVEKEAREEAEKECKFRSYQICIEKSCTAPTECDSNYIDGSADPEQRGKKAAYFACKSDVAEKKVKAIAAETRYILKAKIAATNGG
jgi:hypothetical protein